MKAIGRVNRPNTRNGLPTISSTPANQLSDSISGLGRVGGGNPSSFWVPCSKKISAATMRRMLSTRGAHSARVSLRFIRRSSLDTPLRSACRGLGRDLALVHRLVGEHGLAHDAVTCG